MSVERYAQIENELIESRDRYSQLQAQNEQLINAHKQLFAEHTETRKLLIEQNQKLVDADRYSAIKVLADKYELVDVETEANKCLYSRGSKLSDDDFKSHLAYVEQYAAKAANRPPVGMIPDGIAPSRPVDSALEERISQIVVERFSAKVNRGEFANYDDLRAEVIKEIGGA